MFALFGFLEVGKFRDSVNFRIEFAIFEKSNQKKIGTARKDLGTSLGPQSYAMQVDDDNRRRLRRQR